MHSGTDAEVAGDAFDVPALKRKLRKFNPRLVAFTSKDTAQAAFGRTVDYGLQQSASAKWGLCTVFALRGWPRVFRHWHLPQLARINRALFGLARPP